MILLDTLLNIIGVAAFLAPGVLISFIIFPETDIVERTVYSLSLSIGSLGVISIPLYFLGLLNQFFFFSALLLLVLISSLVILKKQNKKILKTKYKKSIIFILLFSLFGTLWRFLFLKSIPSLIDPYAYSFKFIGQKVPDLGYYTGMAADKSGYVGNLATNKIFEYLHIGYSVINIFLAVFLFLGFIFLLCREYRIDKRLAYLGVALMAIGPIELFYSATSIYGHPLSYVVLLPLFLIFKSKNSKIFWISLFFSVVMMFTYYTSSVTIVLCCFGFLIALLIKNIIAAKNLKKIVISLYKDKKFLSFLIILLVVFSYILFFSKMFNYSFGRMLDSTDSKINIERITDLKTNKNINSNTNTGANVGVNTNTGSTIYADPSFLHLSAIRWQMLFFFLCGFTLIFNLLLKRKISEENLDLLLCLIPVIIVSCGFMYVNLPARIFDYFAFFGLIALVLPKKYFKTIFIISFCFILITGIYVAKDKKIFLESSRGEYSGAGEIKNSLNGKIFSDETFANQLILSGYYDVTGANDKDQLVKNLFYQNDKQTFLDSINYLKSSGVDYVAITERMREKYVLMLNYPQKPIFDFNLFVNNLRKAYDNGDVMVYSTNTEKNKKIK